VGEDVERIFILDRGFAYVATELELSAKTRERLGPRRGPI
jgi:hypothetical protein